jgi:hypothetical protein
MYKNPWYFIIYNSTNYFQLFVLIILDKRLSIIFINFLEKFYCHHPQPHRVSRNLLLIIYHVVRFHLDHKEI